ncbi:electron transport complex subunit RsxD [[Haemophilus] ducreyi]|uniref:Ion-translocating oxidoreductase complex subunit D n=2 Tax=Haemophilus ducreyi TaxID=730 RepID=RNFD_HAEDU|nr:electron transport complex subunit RsxD [[Haemophilus] ducreyi]Q7VNT3.1 RecName: Full=Ion-translocating oxidoreductase complex subunit D; AltName: Full=Rnf electron transport complex subunit D [[Haemophilus] ducreyi 35000HP]AAP95366.1 putative Na-translocating NADH-quinone reductase [[Haemophilus] ducreyi 35000HP]AKO30488.1 electron transporter RnfD [[Haemophilus] ducreyi]AKO31923.1 electron transporter RnfD [[Haemophilus] ducreyi]AKO33377.1 electron transporter RnfD [[Haemophilus] ducreyi]
MFKMVSSPHTHGTNLTAKFMLWVIVAMLPALIVQIAFFGTGVVIQLAIALSMAIVIEIVVAKLRHKSTTFYLADLAGVVTATILAMAIPPYAPYWVVMIGMIVALLLAKHCYGGLGQNLFNPAMVAYAFLLISFPVQMTSWLPSFELLAEPPTFKDAWLLIFKGVTSDGFTSRQLLSGIDGIAQATPLDSAKTSIAKLGFDGVIQSPIFSGIFARGWLQLNLAFLAGGLFLLYKRIIHWQIPVAMLVVFSVLSALTDLVTMHTHLNVLSQLFSGAMMFGAFFIATDPVSASITPKGKLIFGGLIGLLAYLIRYYGSYPDAIAFAVLLANLCVPLIDHYTQPRLYGTHK